jgi:hypothetical protein
MTGAHLFAAALIFTAAQFPARPERPPLRTGTATISGHVIDAITDKPVADIDVQLGEELEGERTAASVLRGRAAIAKTDADGAFAFPKIAAGKYQIVTIGKTHMPACFGASRQSRGPCVLIEIEDGQRYRNADVFVQPAALIKGRVFDHEGAPVPLGSIRVTWSDRDERAGLGTSVINGNFEIGGLQPGTVTISVDVVAKNGAGMVRAYYPGVLQPGDAVPLSVEIGTPLEVEIRIPRIVMGSINAHVSGADGFRLDKLTLVRPDAKSILTLTREDDGIARVINLREGRYVIEARGTLKGKPLATFANVDVGDGVTDVAVDLTDAGTVAGRVIAERGGLPPLSNVRVAAVWMLDGVEVDPMRSDEIAVGADGAFSFSGLFGARVFQVSGLDSEWQVVSIRAGRTEIGDRAFDVIGQSRTELTITVGRR